MLPWTVDLHIMDAFGASRVSPPPHNFPNLEYEYVLRMYVLRTGQ